MYKEGKLKPHEREALFRKILGHEPLKIFIDTRHFYIFDGSKVDKRPHYIHTTVNFC